MTGRPDRPAEPPIFAVRAYAAADAPRLAELQRRCLVVCADMDEMPEGFYANPAFDGGRNIFCAVVGRPTLGGGPGPAGDGEVIGYGSVFRFPDPQYLYLDIKVDPEHPSPIAVKDALLERVVLRAREMASSLPPGLRTLLYGCYFTSGEASLDYLASKGFTRHEPEEERVRYLMAHNTALPYNYLDLESFEHLLRVWDSKTYGAFAGDDVVGSATVLTPAVAGVIEYLFVLPAWRGKGIGRALVRAALRHFMDKGLARARLDTGTENTAARVLYESMGYRVTREAVSLGLQL